MHLFYHWQTFHHNFLIAISRHFLDGTALAPAKCLIVDVPLNVILGQPVEDTMLGAFKLAIEAFGGVIVDALTGLLFVAEVDVGVVGKALADDQVRPGHRDGRNAR